MQNTMNSDHPDFNAAGRRINIMEAMATSVAIRLEMMPFGPKERLASWESIWRWYESLGQAEPVTVKDDLDSSSKWIIDHDGIVCSTACAPDSNAVRESRIWSPDYEI